MPFSHVPIGEAEVARLTAPIEFEFRRRETRWHRLSSVGIFAATALATLAWLRHVEGDAGYVRDLLGACALAIGFFAFRLRASQRSVHALLHEWQVAHRLAPLVRAEAEDLRLAAMRDSELAAALAQWHTAGLALRLRDFDAINAALRAKGLPEAGIEVDALDRFLEVGGVTA